MRRFSLFVLFFLSIFVQGFSQIRLNTLTVAFHEVYEIQGSDILVVDTLILKDSSRIRLNHSKRDNFIHAKKIIAGKGCVINGKGKKRVTWKVGNPGTSNR